MDRLRGLWRGKRTQNDEWVEGYLIQDKNADFICTITSYYPVSFKPNLKITSVDTSTLGECTGLHDGNGKPIFEDDICTVDDETGVVRYDEESAIFIIDFDYHIMDFYNDVFGWDVEVIGNIHDNPELLSGK